MFPTLHYALPVVNSRKRKKKHGTCRNVYTFLRESCDSSKCISVLYSKQVNDKLYIYLEYVSGGSIHKLLQEYGQFGEQAIRSYTKQILLGLAYLHAKNTVHR